MAYIPAPSVKSPGRASVISKLQRIGKAEFAQGSGEADFDADFNYSFSVKVLLDTPALFSLDTTTYWTPPHGGAYGSRHSYLFEMNEGLEYDIGRLYRARNPKGGLIARMVALVVRHMDPRQLDTPQAVAADVTEALSQGEPQLFVSKKGGEVWPESGLTWLDSPIIPWAELRPT